MGQPQMPDWVLVVPGAREQVGEGAGGAEPRDDQVLGETPVEGADLEGIHQGGLAAVTVAGGSQRRADLVLQSSSLVDPGKPYELYAHPTTERGEERAPGTCLAFVLRFLTCLSHQVVMVSSMSGDDGG